MFIPHFLYIYIFALTLKNFVASFEIQPFTYPYRVETRLKDLLGNVTENLVTVNWVLDPDSPEVHFEAELKSSKSDQLLTWFGIGISDHGDFEGSDLCVFYVLGNNLQVKIIYLLIKKNMKSVF